MTPFLEIFVGENGRHALTAMPSIFTNTTSWYVPNIYLEGGIYVVAL